MTRTDLPRFVFFGTPDAAVIVLEELRSQGLIPTLIITTPPRPQGRSLALTPTPVARYATEHKIPFQTPETLRDEAVIEILKRGAYDLFVVVVYGKLIPDAILAIPPHGTLNVHPSLLPKFRGPSPIKSVILSDEKETGVSIMLLDAEMDHGPIVAQERLVTHEWPPKGSVLETALAHQGGALLAKTIPEWITHPHTVKQDHSQATFTKKISKEDGLIDLAGDPNMNYKKIRAYDDWPGAYFFTERNGKQIRVRVTDATLENGILTVTRVLPEGKKEMSYEDFLRGTIRGQ